MKTVEGLLWCGYIGECEKDKRVPCYLLNNTKLHEAKKTMNEAEDGIFLCDILKEYAGKQIKMTIENIDYEDNKS